MQTVFIECNKGQYSTRDVVVSLSANTLFIEQMLYF